MVLFRTVAHSLKILHDLDIVHSDLKPSNVLIKRTELGHTTKLIDFDNSYVVGSPPPAEEIVGTMNYYSPELVRYIQGDATAADLTPASDIFALGLIFAEYLAGSVPTTEPVQRSVAVAVLNGHALNLTANTTAPGIAEVVELIRRMLLLDPAHRPDIGEVHNTLMGIGRPAATTAKRPGPPVAPPSLTAATRAAASHAPVSASLLRGRGLRIAAGLDRSGTPSAPAITPSGKLGGRLLQRFGKGADR